MKIKISIPGKTTIESPILKTTNYALLIGNDLHINPEGYEGEVKIIELKQSQPTPDAFWNIWQNAYMPENMLAVFPGKFTFNPIFP